MPIRWEKSSKVAELVAAAASAAAGVGVAGPLAALADLGPPLWAALEGELPAHDPPLSPRDEAIFLLHTAAEIEHALLVQYLYAAYSLKDPQEVSDQPQKEALTAWRDTVLDIAKEEMGHLMTVQNLLLLLGAPLHFDRQHFPFQSEFYPFEFVLQPLSKKSLAKYVLAEKPDDPGHEYLPADVEAELRERVDAEGQGVLVNRVGALYARLVLLIATDLPAEFPGAKPLYPDGVLPADAGFSALQAPEKDWTATDAGKLAILVPSATTRQEALQALKRVMAQGEAGMAGPTEEMSHFKRFYALYQVFPDSLLGPGGWKPTRNVPANPNTLGAPGASVKAGNITNPRSRGWADLFSLHYRLLLGLLSHYLLEGQSSRRAFLNDKSLGLMTRLSQLAAQITALPLGKDEGPARAGPPFELPYTLDLPGQEQDRWRQHLYVHQLKDDLIETLAANEQPAVATRLRKWKLTDTERQTMEAYMTSGATGPAGGPGNPTSPPAGGGPTPTTSFQRDIRPLFRDKDIEHMSDWFDLSKYEDVRDNSQKILMRLQGQGGARMPPDQAWPPQQIQLFARWIQDACPP